MTEKEKNTTLPNRLRLYIAIVAIVGTVLMAYLVQGVDWQPVTVSEVGLFALLIVAAGSLPLPVGPKVNTDVTSAPLFAAAILLEPGAAVLAGVSGLVAYTLLLRFWGAKLRLPWYKYPFNAGQTALFIGATSLVYHGLNSGDSLLGPAIVPAVATYYLVNTSVVSCTASLQLGLNPVKFWLMGTRETGMAELSALAFGFMGAALYRESVWAVATLAIPIAVLYVSFARLAQKIAERELAKGDLEKAKEELEIRVQLRTRELTTANEQLGLSRRRIVNAQEHLRKTVAAQLHGPVQNRLLVATHWFRTAQEAMPHDVARSAEHLANAAHLIEEINQGDLRVAMGRLHPSLIRVSLISSLRSLSDQFAQSFHVELHTSGDGSDTPAHWCDDLSEELRLVIYRVAEETLNNVLKHAAATRVDMWLEHPDDTTATLTIHDNGDGFDPTTATLGFGILSMQDYCGATGGSLHIESNLSMGTTIVAMFPLQIPNSNEGLKESVGLSNGHPLPALSPFNGNGAANRTAGHQNGALHGDAEPSNGHSLPMLPAFNGNGAANRTARRENGALHGDAEPSNGHSLPMLPVFNGNGAANRTAGHQNGALHGDAEPSNGHSLPMLPVFNGNGAANRTVGHENGALHGDAEPSNGHSLVGLSMFNGNGNGTTGARRWGGPVGRQRNHPINRG